MKVRVIKATGVSWSHDYIGKVFEVDEHTDERFYVLSCDALNEDEKRLLKKENCEIVDDTKYINSKQK